ncbi:hypothetical protein BH20CHL6_BH20CHL6_14620 [soil metagenome]
MGVVLVAVSMGSPLNVPGTVPSPSATEPEAASTTAALEQSRSPTSEASATLDPTRSPTPVETPGPDPSPLASADPDDLDSVLASSLWWRTSEAGVTIGTFDGERADVSAAGDDASVATAWGRAVLWQPGQDGYSFSLVDPETGALKEIHRRGSDDRIAAQRSRRMACACTSIAPRPTPARIGESGCSTAPRVKNLCSSRATPTQGRAWDVICCSGRRPGRPSCPRPAVPQPASLTSSMLPPVRRDGFPWSFPRWLRPTPPPWSPSRGARVGPAPAVGPL